MIKSYSRQQKVIALSSAEAELYGMVAASAETLAIIAYATDLGISLGGEVYAESSAALGISQRIGIGQVRHLRQGLWVQETRISGRLAYHKVLGTKATRTQTGPAVAKRPRAPAGGILTLGSHVIKSYSRQQKVIALSSAEAELYGMVAASAETLAIIAYATDLGISLGGEVYAESSAALGISQRIGIGQVRHLRQGLWVQETRISGRLAYHKVLGTKNPADVLTKHVPGELLERHLETLGAEMRGGRAELAPELMSLATSWVQWYRPLEAEEETNGSTRKVTFAKKVQFRAVEHKNKGRSCKDRSVGRINKAWKTVENDKTEKPRWCDVVDTCEEELKGTTIDPEGEACQLCFTTIDPEGEAYQLEDSEEEHNWQVQKVSLGPSSASTKVLGGGQDTKTGKKRSTKSKLSRRSWRAEEPQLIPDEWFKHGARNDLTWLKPSVGCGGNHFDGSGSRLPLVADRTVEVGLLQLSVLCPTSRRERSWRSA